jgi:hypothetical protein
VASDDRPRGVAFHRAGKPMRSSRASELQRPTGHIRECAGIWKGDYNTVRLHSGLRNLALSIYHLRRTQRSQDARMGRYPLRGAQVSQVGRRRAGIPARLSEKFS